MDKQLPPTKHKLKTGNHNIQTNYQFKVEKYQRKNMEKFRNSSEFMLGWPSTAGYETYHLMWFVYPMILP